MNKQWLATAQQRLETIGLYTAGVDGQWGPATERAFENALALAEKLSGVNPPAYPNLPAQYRWLTTIGTLPLIVHEGLKLLGTREIVGPKHSPEILSWARELGLAAVVPNDEQAWCGLLMAIVAKRAQKDFSMVGNVLGARNWLKFGVPADKPSLGDVMVFWRGSKSGWQGHVAEYIGEDATHYHILGGNQLNMVRIDRIKKDRLIQARRPLYNSKPLSVIPYKVAAAGTVSRNEA